MAETPRKPLHRSWRRRLARGWAHVEWPCVGMLALAAVVLVYVGLGSAERSAWWQRLYDTLWYLGPGRNELRDTARGYGIAARWMLFVVAVYAVVKAWAVIFREQWQLVRLHFRKRHAVLCGLGERGTLLGAALRERGIAVVGIDLTRLAPGMDRLREQGGIAFVGDATEERVLEHARIARADYVIALCGDDATNLAIAARARTLAGTGRVRPLTCFVHIADMQLFALVRQHELAADREPGFRLQAFNLYESGARALLAEYPVPAGGTHVVVVGLGRVGSYLVVEAARRWRSERPSDGARLRVTAVDVEADERVARLQRAVPALAQVCDVVPVRLGTTAPEFADAAFLVHDGRRASQVYVCLSDQTKALAAGLTLRPMLRRHRIPCVVRVATDPGLDALLGLPFDQIDTDTFRLFGMLPRTCRVELLLHGTNEVLAQACHDDYVRAQRANGHTRHDNGALVAWEMLPEHLRESNRQLADDIARKVDAVGYEIVPLVDWLGALPRLSAAEIDVMARMEHARWADERRKAGWRSGPEKDVDQQITPYLVPWEALDEENKEKDRATVRNIPQLLARCGLTLARRAEG